MTLPYHYVWEWQWKAEGKYLVDSHIPSEAKVSDYIREKVAKTLAEKYIAKGHQIYVVNVASYVKRTFLKQVPIGKDRYQSYYRWEGTTKTEYYTDLNAKVASPIDPITIMLLATAVSAIVTLMTVAFKWYLFITAVDKLSDVSKGITEPLGLPKETGWAIIFFVVVALLFVYLIGKYWKRKRR